MRDPLRVAIVSRAVFPLHGYGGLERHVFDLVRHLLRRDVRVTLITRPPQDRPAEAAGAAAAVSDDPRLSVRFVPYLTFPFAGRRGTTAIDRSTAYLLFGARAGRVAARMVEAGEVDLVHGLGASVLGYALAPAGLRARAPLVLNPQGLEEFGGTGRRDAAGGLKRLAYAPLRWAVRACAAAAASVIATDKAIEPSVRRYLPVAADRIVTIPNAIDLEACDGQATPADVARARGQLAGRPGLTLLSVGRVERNKGFHVLADALARLGDRPWTWVLVGDGPFRPAVERALAIRSLSARVLMAGRVPTPELHAWYEAADLFVHPTLYEGSSLVTLEAMAHRRAVLATTAGGLPDKVRPGVTGWLVPPGEAGAMAAALVGAMDHSEDLPRLGTAGRTVVEREFSWEPIADRTIRLYRQLIGP